MNKKLIYLLHVCLVYILLTPYGGTEAQDNSPTQFFAGSWNAQNTHVALSSGSSLWIYDDELRFVAELDVQHADADGEEHIRLIRWSPDGNYLATTVNFEGLLRDVYTFYEYSIVWDTTLWQRTTTIESVRSGSSLAWNPINGEFAVITGTYDPKLEIYSGATGNFVRELLGNAGGIIGFDWNPANSNEMAIAMSGSLQLWDPINLQQQATLTTYHSDTGPRYNPLGNQIAFMNDNLNIEIWDTQLEQLIQTIDATSDVLSFGWVNDKILTFEIDGTQRLWDVSTDPPTTIPSSSASRIWNTDGSVYLLLEPDRVVLFDTESDGVQAQLFFSTAAQVSSFTGMDSSTNEPISQLSPLTSGDTIDLGQLNTDNLAIRANTNPENVGSVVFDLNGVPNVQIDDTSPYEFTNWTPAPGAYTLTATPYSGAGGTGTAGTPLTIHFTVEAQ